MQNEMRFDPPTHPERSQEAHDEGPGGSSVVQEIVAETQAERDNRENESCFREQPAEQNSSPVDCCATHSPAPVRMQSDTRLSQLAMYPNTVVKIPLTSWQLFPSGADVIPRPQFS